ncbi:MAG: M15 family metallopeptidase [Clostridia bacterium]|nr:M15 family metallopeptidase [Clostridia bacterium]
MKIKKKYRILCLILAVAVLGVGIGYVLSRGDWWFYLEQTFRIYSEPDLKIPLRDETSREWTLAELMQAEGVTVSKLLMLVNSSHPLPVGYEAELEEYGGALMHPLMIAPYIALKDAVYQRTGVKIYVSSDYRTREEQESILAESEDGVAAQIGCSEHEAGMALDVYAPYHAGMEFLKSEAGREVNRICCEYGYVIRYPHGKEDVTGIAYEPWHLRYVGAPHAKIMADSGLTLEEYIEYLTPETWYESGEYLILRTEKNTVSMPAEWETCSISPDNTGYTIITVKR